MVVRLPIHPIRASGDGGILRYLSIQRLLDNTRETLDSITGCARVDYCPDNTGPDHIWMEEDSNCRRWNSRCDYSSSK